MRKLQQSEITNWNTRLSHNNINDPTLSIINYQYKDCLSLTIKDRYSYMKHEIKLPFDTSFNFSYSVNEKTITRFDNILSELLESGMIFNTIEDKMVKTTTCQKPIEFFNKFLSEREHNIQKAKYKQRIFKFTNISLFDLIYFVSCVEDTVKIIQKYFEYDINGNEITKVKYPVGTIVSLKEKSGDFFIQGLKFIRDDINNPGIRYLVSKIESNINSEILIFSNIFESIEDDIKPNRDDRINSILN